MTDECHMEQVKSVLEHTCSVSCMAFATEVGISPASVYHILTSSLGKQKVCAKWMPYVLNDDQKPCVFFLQPPISNTGEIKTKHSWIAFSGQQFIGCIHFTLSRNDRMVNGVPNITEEENCMAQ